MGVSITNYVHAIGQNKNKKKMMLCKKGSEKDLKKKWLAQRKVDGVRVMCFCLDGNVVIKGRSGNYYTKKFPEIVKELKGINGVIDGELYCGSYTDTERRVHTENPLKSKLLAKKYPAILYAFDTPIKKPLTERISYLHKLVVGLRSVQFLGFSYDVEGLWEQANFQKWEGIIIKNPDSFYENKRSNNWLKIKIVHSEDVWFDRYTINPAGIRLENEVGTAVQCTGSNHVAVKNEIDEKGKCLVEIEYLNKTENGKFRMPVFKCKK